MSLTGTNNWTDLARENIGFGRLLAGAAGATAIPVEREWDGGSGGSLVAARGGGGGGGGTDRSGAGEWRSLWFLDFRGDGRAGGLARRGDETSGAEGRNV